MRAELKHLQHELKITTVYVTHDQIEAMTLADRVAVMDHGIISQLGPPEEIYNDPANLFCRRIYWISSNESNERETLRKQLSASKFLNPHQPPSKP